MNAAIKNMQLDIKNQKSVPLTSPVTYTSAALRDLAEPVSTPESTSLRIGSNLTLGSGKEKYMLQGTVRFPKWTNSTSGEEEHSFNQDIKFKLDDKTDRAYFTDYVNKALNMACQLGQEESGRVSFLVNADDKSKIVIRVGDATSTLNIDKTGLLSMDEMNYLVTTNLSTIANAINRNR